jgi:uncharacterized protein
MTMTVRKIEGDFSQAKIDWIPNDPELAYFWNAISLGLPLLEGYMIRAVAEAKRQLPESRPDLKSDCELFCRQEANHTKAHMQFNELVKASGRYPKLQEHIEKLRNEYKKMDEAGTAKEALLYSEGFETVGPILAEYFLVQANKRLTEQDVDLITLSLWRWHLSEEFEHRCVAFNAVEALYGAYWARLWGIVRAGTHLSRFAISLSEYMLEEDFKAGLIQGGWRGRLRKTRSYSSMLGFILPRIGRACMPWYNPKNLKAPKGCQEVLDIATRTPNINVMASQAREAV